MGEYRSWKDLVDEDEASDAAAPTAAAEAPSLLTADPGLPPPDGQPTLDDLRERGLLPEELEGLLREHERLRGELDALTGRAKPGPDDERLARCFPMEVHDKHRRLAQGRTRRAEERQRQMGRRRLETAIMDERRERMAELRREALARARRIEGIITRRAALRRRACEAERRKEEAEKQRLHQRRLDANARARARARQAADRLDLSRRLAAADRLLEQRRLDEALEAKLGERGEAARARALAERHGRQREQEDFDRRNALAQEAAKARRHEQQELDARRGREVHEREREREAARDAARDRQRRMRSKRHA